jgi:O-methyltransferase involved in polyketide biosynthesis
MESRVRRINEMGMPMTEKISLHLGTVQETLVLPLWGRAVESTKEKPKLIDRKAVEIIKRLDYDFTLIAKNISRITQLAWVARSLHVDRAIRNFITIHPESAIVNIGCGLDTTFERNDNGRFMFYELDLPDVIELRKSFFTESERRKSIAGSFLDTHWFRHVQEKRNVLFIAAGVMYYFSEQQIHNFMLSVLDHFYEGEFFFDISSPLGVKVANKKVIQNSGMDETAILRWGIESAKDIEQWDNRIKVLEEYPMFHGFKKGYSCKMKYGLWMSDALKIMSMVHLKLEQENLQADTYCQSGNDGGAC